MAKSQKDKPAKTDWKGVSEEVQGKLLSHLSEEFAVAARNNEQAEKDFDSYYNMIHAVREAKPNEWESDIYMPEFLSRLQTQVGNFVAQYFSSTDYVEPDLDSDDPTDVAEAKAAKKLLNTLLKDKKAHYYHKVVRMIMFVFTCGYGVIKGGYSQKIKKVLSHYSTRSEYALGEDGNPIAEDGTPYIDPTIQRPAFQEIQEPQFIDKVATDKPVFDVYPIQNVKMSPEYAYSMNDKEYVYFDTEKTIDQLKAEKEEMGYFNLDFLEEKDPDGQRGAKTYNRDGDKEEQSNPPQKTFVEVERWGKYPTIQNEDGEYLPGIDEEGKWADGAENVECIIHLVKEREKDEPFKIIGFRKSKHTTRPMVRFLCYVDMLKDCGFGDGEANYELQKAINDNFNLMNYRTKLAITPAFKGRKFSGIPEKIRISPESVIMMENLDNDLKEIVITDNIQGGIVENNMLSSRMDFAMATTPQTMGAAGDRAETATVGNIINQRANVRIGMKSMNLEFIGFTDFYDMLLTLCNDFMLQETLEELIGEEAQYYNPKRDDKFKPVSQALETEESKAFKINMWQQQYQAAMAVPNPRTPMVLNYIQGQILELIGGDFNVYKKFMYEEDPQTMFLYMLATGSKGGGMMGTPPGGGNLGAPAQNQQGLPQSGREQMTRQAAPMQQQ